MTWNFTAECLAFVIACIILAYSNKSYLTPNLKNGIFQACLIITVFAIALNIASTVLIQNKAADLNGVTWFVTMLYFVATPLIGTAYFYYAYATIVEAGRHSRPVMILGAVPYVFYLLCVIANIWTDCLFSIDAQGRYHQGSFLIVTYIVFYLYCAMCFGLTFASRKYLDPAIMRILTFFPLLAVAVIVIQQIFPTYILSGSAAVCSLLIVYLNLQNKQISIDFLTGIPNRQEFSKMIALEMKRQRPFTAVIVSINNFKFLNDKFGSDNGDAFLGSFSAYLHGTVDTPWLYRYGGDQFVALYEGERRTTMDSFLALLQSRMDEPWQVEENQFVISCSIGVVSYPDEATSSSTIVNALEYCADESKRLGPNVACRCTEDMVCAISRKHHIADILRTTLADDGFDTHYQPIWSIPRQRFTSAEALCRLNSTDLGTISPAEFIPIAEETGLIVDMTYQTLGKVCSFIKTAHDSNPACPLECVSVNYSTILFMQSDLADKTLGIIEASGIAPSSIKIEITESALVSNFDAARAFILTMHDAGVQFCLDDFGTGFSNLSTILELPFDIIKLDKNIVWRASKRDRNGDDFLKHIIAAFKTMGSDVLAEGVETESQCTFVEQSGCSLVQGFLFAKPLPAQEALRFIEEQR